MKSSNDFKSTEDPAATEDPGPDTTSQGGKTTTRRRRWSFHKHFKEGFIGQHLEKYTKAGSNEVGRMYTKLEKDVMGMLDKAKTVVSNLPENEASEELIEELPEMKLFTPDSLKGAVFCGHLVTDLDSIAGAIGASKLYGGIPAAASEINSETEFALELFGLPVPKRIELILETDPNTKVCLVDHQQTSQMNPAIQESNVVGIIDHHALQNKTLVTEKPIYVDIRPWGSMSTVVAHSYLIRKLRLPRPIAGILLCAILSDTLNLQSPTTTDWDKLVVTILAELAEIEDINELAKRQFHAKSKELKNLSAYSLVHGDQKSFSFDRPGGFAGELGFAVIETTDDEAILARVDELVEEMQASKKESSLTLLYVAIVNIVKLHSNLLLCGPAETSLSKEAFPDGVILSDNDTVMNLGSRVSRKKEFIPALASAIDQGWNWDNAERDVDGEDDDSIESPGELQIFHADPHGQIQRMGSLRFSERSVSERSEELVACT